MKPAVRQLLLAGRGNSSTPMVTVACGNSITAQAKFSGTSWSFVGDIHIANCLAGSPMRFLPMTATTRCDAFGVYGFSGATLDTINGDMAAQWINPVKAAGITPDLVVGLSLFENDISTGGTTAQILARLDTWLATVRAAWPQAKILLCTPRPNALYDTAGEVTVFQEVTSAVQARDDGKRIFVTRLNAYENGASLATPLAGYTSDGTHPNAKGAMANARLIATTLARMGTRVYPVAFNGTNRMLTGSGAASGTNVSGTWPTGCSFNGGSVNGTYVSTALNPSWQIQMNTPVAGAGLDIGFINLPSTSAAPALVSAFAKVQIVSGGTNLRSIELQPRIQDAGGNTFRLYLSMQSLDADMDYVDGDVFTFVAPPVAANSGAILAVANYLMAKMKNTTAATTIKVLEAGFYAIQ